MKIISLILLILVSTPTYSNQIHKVEYSKGHFRVINITPRTIYCRVNNFFIELKPNEKSRWYRSDTKNNYIVCN